jgi:hypothetical protein
MKLALKSQFLPKGSNAGTRSLMPGPVTMMGRNRG